MNDRGGAAVLLVAVVGVVLLLAAVLGAVGSFLLARVEAAARAAAPVTFLPFGATGTPTQEAARFAAANGARLLSCSCPLDPSWEPRAVTVQVARQASVWPIGSITVTATGRAEFLPALLLTEE